jgi:hypothetical protein
MKGDSLETKVARRPKVLGRAAGARVEPGAAFRQPEYDEAIFR